MRDRGSKINAGVPRDLLTAFGTAHTLRSTIPQEARMLRVSVMYPSGEGKKFDDRIAGLRSEIILS
jgi:hypothetical protein